MSLEGAKRVRKGLGDSYARGGYRQVTGEVPRSISLEPAKQMRKGFEGGIRGK